METRIISTVKQLGIGEVFGMKKREQITRPVQKIQAQLIILGLAAVFILLSAIAPSHVGAQTPSLTLRQTYLNASSFPEIVAGVVVRDGENRPVGGLTESNFSVYEDGVLQLPILVEEFKADSGGVSVVLIMDISGSMRDELPDAQIAAKTLVDLLTADDFGALISFDDVVEIVQQFTNNFDLLKSAIDGLQNGSGTAVYDATLTGLDLVRNQPGKKAIVLLSDGRDGDSNANLGDVTSALGSAGIPVYAIGLGVSGGRGEDELIQIAQASGGIYYSAPTTAELQEIYLSIAYFISKYTYRITYTTSNCAADGTQRQVDIVANKDGLAASDTSSYIAPFANSQIVLQTDIAPTPTQPFMLQLITPTLDDFTNSVSKISMRIRYNSEHLQVQTPYAQFIKAGPMFGDATAHTLTQSVDEAAGIITLTIQRLQPVAATPGSNVLAEIGFIAKASLPDSTSLTFEIDSLLATNSAGCEMVFDLQPITVLSDGMLVWPGDTDANGRVELADILVLGLYWSMTGPARPATTDPILWKAHLAKRFPIVSATHADADGEGQISERDLIPIALNWGQTTATVAGARPKTAHVLPEGAVSYALDQSVQADKYQLRIQLARANSAPLAGVMLRLALSSEQSAITQAVVGSLWQNDALFFSQIEPDGQHLSVGIMLKPGTEFPTSDGELLRVALTANAGLSPHDIHIESIGLVSPDGRINEGALAQIQKGSVSAVPDVIELERAYPNPFNPATTIRFQVNEPVDVIAQFYRVSGELIQSVQMADLQAGTHTLMWHGKDGDGRTVGSGTYFVRFIATDRQGRQFRRTQKLILIK